MKKKYKAQLFKIFQDKEDDFRLYNEITNLMDNIILDYVCEDKCEQYLFLIKLSNSINNAGHEERRSNDISKISRKGTELLKFIQENNREDFLP